MKHSERPVIISGAVLLLAAAFFTISIMSHFVHFGTDNGGIFLLSIGSILFSVYGYSCFLIPVFLFVSAMVLFMPNWDLKKAVLLGVSILPFFTVVVMERVCRILLPDSTLPVFMVKLIAVLCIGIILIVIEYLSASVIYESVCEMKTAHKKQHKLKSVKEEALKSSKDTLSVPVRQQADENTFVHAEDGVLHVEQEDESLVIAEIEEKGISQYASLNAAAPKKEKEISDFMCDNNYLGDLEVVSGLEEVSEPEALSIETCLYLNKAADDNNTVELEDLEEVTIESFQDKAEIQESIQRGKIYEDNKNILESELFRENPQFGEPEQGPSYEEVNNASVLSDQEAGNEAMGDGDVSNFAASAPIFCLSHEEASPAVVPEIREDSVIPFEFSAPDLSILDIAAMQNNQMTSTAEEDFLSDPFEEIEDEVKDDFDVEEDVLAEEEEDYESILFDDAEIEEPVKEYSCPPAVPGSPVKYQKKNRIYSVPTENLLTTYPDGEYWIIDKDTQDAAALLKETLSEFRIQAEVTGIRKGPVITMFEILPAPGVKLSKIVALQDNIALRLAASSVRIVAPIPGKSAVGIEVPNRERAIVSFKELIEADNPAYKKMNIPVILGKDITGEGQFLDLTKTPHLLIAGSTGSGKSVCVNTMILSILYKRSPQEVKMILIDPKVVELKLYNDIPHLLTPVITEPKKAFQALQYCLCEMERRYALLDGMGVREISSYNRRIIERNIATEKLPYIVVVIDEFADLMATTGKELESTVARLAAMSRAVGIHLVLATQRPSIDVITGLIKANIPTRIAFMVASKMDSRIIIDQVGAEKLLGKGDMLYASATDPFPIRIQGTFVSDSEVENVVEYVKTLGEPEYIDEEIFVEDEDDISIEPGLFGDGDDPLYDKALEIVIQAGKASASYIQRRLKIGYNRAARLVEDMEARGIVGPANGSKPREIVHIP